MLTKEMKYKAIEKIAEAVMREINCDKIEACIKMRDKALESNNEDLANDLKEYALSLILKVDEKI